MSFLGDIGPSVSPEETTDRCKRYLQTHYQDSISLGQLSALLGRQSTALCRKFRHDTGITIFQYLIRLRVEAACQMLRNTPRPVSEIAYRCGFGSLPHFNRKFREVYGMAPKDYRAQNG